MNGRARKKRKKAAGEPAASQPASQKSHEASRCVESTRRTAGSGSGNRWLLRAFFLSLAVTHRHQPPKKEKNRKKRTTTTIWLASFSLSGSLFSEAPGNLLRWSDGLIIYGPSTRHPGRMASNCSATTHPAGRRGRCLRSGHSSARIKLCDVVLVSALCITISVSILIPSTT